MFNSENHPRLAKSGFAGSLFRGEKQLFSDSLFNFITVFDRSKLPVGTIKSLPEEHNKRR